MTIEMGSIPPGELAQDLIAAGLLKTWYRARPEGWTLVSGIWSPFYVQLRPLVSHPALLRRIGVALAALLEAEVPAATRLVGIAMAGIPLAVATSLESGIPAAFTRKQEPDRHGEHSWIEGDLSDGDRVVLIDDVVTGFDSKRVALSQLAEEANRRHLNVHCHDIAVVIDRAQGADSAASNVGVTIHSVIRLDAEGLEAIRPALEGPEYDVIRSYLQHPEHFQNEETQRRLKDLSRARKNMR